MSSFGHQTLILKPKHQVQNPPPTALFWKSQSFLDYCNALRYWDSAEKVFSADTPTIESLSFFNLGPTIASKTFTVKPRASFCAWVGHHHHPVDRVFWVLWLANCQVEVKMVPVDGRHVYL
jgi:hypothetical protein